jgi:L-threonylcarbamoyladenylate synthase
MKVVKMNQKYPDMDLIEEAIEVLSVGGIVLYPTDTIYGLAANAFNEKAVEKIYKIKNRGFNKPISVCVSSIKGLSLIADLRDDYLTLVKKHLPGPFTFIFYKNSAWSNHFFDWHKKIGVRIPNNEIAICLSQNFPITSTSANISNKEVLDSPEKILKQLNQDIDFVIDIGPIKSSIPSTVVDLTGKKPVILRDGLGKL